MLFYEDNRYQLVGSYLLNLTRSEPFLGCQRREYLCALAGILIPTSAQRHSPPNNYAPQLCAVQTPLRFFS